ncbi:S8 family peptidase [Sphingobium tyrosinilyticum]|uniref:S8 family serine peptidase n=1 Tax=Sphingobium tyrosinilyticum TaxID=2715436 RepID=A0ABV9EZF1_9SPHN
MIRVAILILVALTALSKPGEAQEAGSSDRILVMLRLPAPHFRSGGSYGGGYSARLSRSQIMREARRIARAHHLTLVSDWPMPLINLNCVVMRLPPGASAEGMAAEISRDRLVQWSQPMHDYQTLGGQAGHDDPLYPAQPARPLWRLDAVHRIATGRGVTVAVIDSGIDARHPDLAGQISANVNFVAGRPLTAERHGTEVAGIIAAKADNGIGIAGIAPGARVAGLRACWQTNVRDAAAVCDSLSIAKALHHAIDRRAPIINMSLGGPPDRLLAMLLDTGMARGASVVAAYDPGRANGGFPASHPGVIAVSGNPETVKRHPVYVAPARDIPATEPGGGWALVDGTSYAAAHVSGLIALIKQARRNRQGRPTLVTSGGVIDALATVQGRTAGCDGPCPASLATKGRD